MKMHNKFLIGAMLGSAGTLVASAGAQAQAVAIADPQTAITGTKAFNDANTKIKAQYKVQLDQADVRRAALQKEIDPLAAQMDANHDGTVNDDELQAAAQAKTPAFLGWQQKQQAGSAELSKLEGPASRAQRYAVEQIAAKYQAALSSTVAKRGVNVLLKPAAVMFVQPTADITGVISSEIDAALPGGVSITPPANWQPGQQGQQGQAAGAPPAASAATTKKPQGR